MVRRQRPGVSESPTEYEEAYSAQGADHTLIGNQ